MQFLLKSSLWEHGKIYDFFPTSFVYTPFNAHLVKKYFAKGERLWIGKPPASSRGRGITISRNIDEFSSMFPTERDESQVDSVPSAPSAPSSNSTFLPHHARNVMILQDYISNPHLVAGYKHDLRLYVVVTSFSPFRAYLYMDGMSRFCTEKYFLELPL